MQSKVFSRSLLVWYRKKMAFFSSPTPVVQPLSSQGSSEIAKINTMLFCHKSGVGSWIKRKHILPWITKLSPTFSNSNSNSEPEGSMLDDSVVIPRLYPLSIKDFLNCLTCMYIYPNLLVRLLLHSTDLDIHLGQHSNSNSKKIIFLYLRKRFQCLHFFQNTYETLKRHTRFEIS
jgi:hypothetical protein